MATKTKIQVKTPFGTLLFEHEAEGNTIIKTLEAAAAGKKDLTGADLTGADLRGAYLTGAYLTGAYLTGAYLTGADLRGADLRGADLTGADLRGADLTGADLTGADLRGAYLTGADLRGADLRGADLRGADLRGVEFAKLPVSWVNQCSRDILYVMRELRSEVPYLRQALIDGKVDGSQYDGECACLVGTLAAGCKKSADETCETIRFYDKGTHNMGESFFLAIHVGDTPEKSEFAKHAVMLCDLVIAEKP